MTQKSQTIVLGSHTLEERSAFISEHIALRTRNKRRPRYNTKTSGRALRGTMSIHSAKNQCAAKQWKKKVRREDRSQAKSGSGAIDV